MRWEERGRWRGEEGENAGAEEDAVFGQSPVASYTSRWDAFVKLSHAQTMSPPLIGLELGLS